MRNSNSFRLSFVGNSAALRVLTALVLVLSPLAAHYIYAAVECTCSPGATPQPVGSNDCIAGTGNCDVKIEWDATNTTSYEEADEDVPCQFKKIQRHETPSIRTENSGWGTYTYCLGGSAACAVCFTAAYAVELASGAIGAALGTVAGTPGGLAGEAAGATVGAGVAGGIAYFIMHGTCNWACNGVVWEPCCFITCTPGVTANFNSEDETCY